MAPDFLIVFALGSTAGLMVAAYDCALEAMQ